MRRWRQSFRLLPQHLAKTHAVLPFRDSFSRLGTLTDGAPVCGLCGEYLCHRVYPSSPFGPESATDGTRGARKLRAKREQLKENSSVRQIRHPRIGAGDQRDLHLANLRLPSNTALLRALDHFICALPVLSSGPSCTARRHSVGADDLAVGQMQSGREPVVSPTFSGGRNRLVFMGPRGRKPLPPFA